MAATQRTIDYNALYSLTADKIHKKGVIQDAISNSNPTFKEFMDKGRIKKKVVGGTEIRAAIMYEHNGTIASYSGLDPINIAKTDGITSYHVPWSQYGGAVTIEGIEQFKNMGKEAHGDLLKEKITQTTAGWAEKCNRDLWDLANHTAVHPYSGNGGRNMISIPTYIQQLNTAAGQVDMDIGHIDQSVETWWKNQNSDGSVATTASLLKSTMATMMNNCSQGPGGSPDLIMTNQKGFELYEASMQEQIRYSHGEKASAGFENMAYKSAKLMWDGYVPDPEAGANGALAGGAEANSAFYFINTGTMTLYVGKDKDWAPRGFQTPVDQDGSVSLYLAYLQLVCDNRRKNGSLYDVPTAFSS